jgi:outer membrane protein assembly factor BamB
MARRRPVMNDRAMTSDYRKWQSLVAGDKQFVIGEGAKLKSIIKMIVLVGLTCQLLPALAESGSAKPGAVVWENREKSASFGQPSAIDAEGSVAVAAGQVSKDQTLQARDWFVRAYDVATGVTLWEDRIDVLGLRDEANAVAVSAGRAFVVGTLQTSTICPSSFEIRAYDLKSGTLLWERHFDCGYGSAVAVAGGQVFAVGSRDDPNTGTQVGAIVAFDAKTGGLLWQTKTASTADPSQFPGRSAKDAAVQVLDDRVFVAGEMLVSSGTRSSVSMYVQAHDRKTGMQLWEHEIPNASFGPTYTVPLAVAGNLLVVGGAANTSDPSFPWDYRVTTLDVRTGALLWSDQVHRQAGGLSAGFGFGSGKLIAYGWDCDDTVFNCHGDVRAYDPKTGTLQWEDRFTGPGGDIIIPLPTTAFSVRGNQVFLGTALLNLQGDEYVWTVRSYRSNDGSLRWQSQTDDGAGYGDGMGGLRVLDDRLYVAGYADRPDGGYDFAVRAYRTDD